MANLTQLKLLEELDGLLLVDKPEGIAFSSVIKAVKRKFNLVKVGHGGSLDAMASGLFVVLLNDANKYADRIMNADRVYTGSLKFGETTDTGDKYGRPIPLPKHILPITEVRGDLFQTEPRFCSVRREGSAVYEIADTGEHSQFLTHVYRFEAESTEGERRFSLTCAKGVIVRALAQDLGATLTTMRREKVGSFSVDDAIPFAKILETEMRDFAALVQPLSRAL